MSNQKPITMEQLRVINDNLYTSLCYVQHLGNCSYNLAIHTGKDIAVQHITHDVFGMIMDDLIFKEGIAHAVLKHLELEEIPSEVSDD